MKMISPKLSKTHAIVQALSTAIASFSQTQAPESRPEKSRESFSNACLESNVPLRGIPNVPLSAAARVSLRLARLNAPAACNVGPVRRHWANRSRNRSCRRSLRGPGPANPLRCFWTCRAFVGSVSLRCVDFFPTRNQQSLSSGDLEASCSKLYEQVFSRSFLTIGDLLPLVVLHVGDLEVS